MCEVQSTTNTRLGVWKLLLYKTGSEQTVFAFPDTQKSIASCHMLGSVLSRSSVHHVVSFHILRPRLSILKLCSIHSSYRISYRILSYRIVSRSQSFSIVSQLSFNAVVHILLLPVVSQNLSSTSHSRIPSAFGIGPHVGNIWTS